MKSRDGISGDSDEEVRRRTDDCGVASLLINFHAFFVVPIKTRGGGCELNLHSISRFCA